MPDFSASTAESTWLDTLLRVSLTGLILCRPVLDAQDSIVDFACVRLNEAAQRRLALPEYPVQAYLKRHFHANIEGVFACCLEAYATGGTHHFEADCPYDNPNDCCRLAAQRHGDLLVVSFADASPQGRLPVEAVMGKQWPASGRWLATEAQLERILDQAPVLLCILSGPEFTVEFANAAYQQLMGGRLLYGQRLVEALPELAGQGCLALLDTVYRTGEPYHGQGVPLHAGSPAGGSATEAYFDFTYQPLFTADGQVEGVMTCAVDVTAQVQARQHAQQSEARFRRLAETAPMIVWEADAAGQTTYLSPHWEQITTAANGQGLGWREYVHPDDQEPFLQAWQQAVGSQQPFRQELRLRVAATGEYRWFLDQADPVRDACGQVVQWVGAAVDIEAQKQAQQVLQTSEQYFRQMANLVPNLIWQIDAAGNCVYLNASWYAYTGHREGAALGRGWQVAVHPDDLANAAAEAGAAVARRRTFTLVYRLRRYDGTYRWVMDVGRPRFDEHGGFAGYIGAVTDIDERQQAEQALQQRTAELGVARDQAQALNQALSARNEQLQALNADLDTFVYMASHDLRGSLLNIEGLVQALDEDLAALSLPPATAHVLHLLHESTGRFKATVDQLLQMVRAQQAPEPKQLTDLVQVLQQVQQDLQPVQEQTQALIEVAPGDCYAVAMAPHNARSIVYNLLSNALKYRHPDRSPHVQISCRQQEAYTVLIVQDNGLGLTAAQQAELFAPFRRFHDHVPGTGIGLYVLKRIVESTGGRVQVHSTLGDGTTFRVFFKR